MFGEGDIEPRLGVTALSAGMLVNAAIETAADTSPRAPPVNRWTASSPWVLVDIKGVDYLEPGTVITVDDFKAWEEKTVTVGSGDVLLFRRDAGFA